MSRAGKVVRYTVTAAVMLCVGYFFWQAFSQNWASIRAMELKPNYWLVALTFAVIPIGVLCSTWAWHASMNGLARGAAHIGYAQSFATVNTSSLTKYVPGKIWAYALQMYWLGSLGFSKSLILYVNFVNLGIALVVNMLLGMSCWLLATNRLYEVVAPCFALLLALDAAFILFSGRALDVLVGLLNRLLRRNIGYFRISPLLMLRLHAAHLLSAVTSGLAALLICFALGYPVSLQLGVLVTASSLISDVAGYLAFMVPGGLGVREGLMFAMLGGAASGPIALVLPLAMRVVTMVSDVAIGAVALKLLPRQATQAVS